MDPVTVGTFASWALGLAGEAMINGVVGKGVEDAYAALKGKLSEGLSGDVAALEKTPASKPRQAVVAEAVDALAPADQATVHELAAALSEQMKSDPALVGLDIGALHAADVQLGSIAVTQGTGVRIRDADVSGTFKVGDISVGDRAGKA